MTRLTISNSKKAITLYDDKDYEGALMILGELRYSEDAQSYYNKCISKIYDSVCPVLYNEAIIDAENGNYEDALETFELIPQYNNSSEWITALREKIGK